MYAQTVSPEFGTAGLILIGVAIFAIVFGTFFPFLVAWGRSHRSTPAIFAVCLFFGWTVVGWFVALVWSLDGNTD